MNTGRKILLTSFDGIPSEKQGGPNNIIYKILRYSGKKSVRFDFLSYRKCYRDFEISGEKDVGPGLKKKITDYLYYNTNLYRFLTSNRIYLKRHFELRDEFFKRHSVADGYGIVHSHDALSGYYFSGLSGTKKILTIHGNGSIESDWADAAAKNKFIKEIIPEFKRREILAFNSADVITFPGMYAKELFLSDYRGKLDKDKDIRIINNGIDAKFIDNIKPGKELVRKYGFTPGHDIVLLNVASHVRQKNIDRILSVIEELVGMKKNPLLINAGTGPLTDDIKSVIRRKNLLNNVQLAGSLGHEEIISLMKLSDAVIMMSDRVIFDLVMLEASACGTPVITDLSGGNREMLENYQGLVKVNVNSAVSTAKLIVEKLYSGKVGRIKKGGFGFDVRRMADEYKKLYGEFLK